MTRADQKGLAIIAGAGDLPRLVAEECARTSRPYQVVGFGNAALKWAVDHPLYVAQFEKPASMFKALKNAGCGEVVFAGAMARPNLNPLKFDLKMLKLAPSLLPAMKSGDDVTLRTITTIFEAEGFKVVGADQVLTNLIAKSGCPTKVQPSDLDQADILRANIVLTHLGQADAGQAAVVANGICLGLESIQGTDAMLEFVANTAAPFRRGDAKGVLVKAAKPDQSRLVDMPTIGPDTMKNAHQAGLAGVCVFDGSALILDLDATIATADKLGLFLQISDTDA